MNNLYYYVYPYPNYYVNVPIRTSENMWSPICWGMSSLYPYPRKNTDPILEDYGKTPFVLNINRAARQNSTYRTVIWTGSHLQVTLMSIDVGDDIGLEVHPNADQFIYIVEGQGVVEMGKSKNQLNYVRNAFNNSAITIPAGTWHNVTNKGNVPLKLYTIYAPPLHPFGAVEKTKAEAEAVEG